jgi:hypothetical protein
MKNLSGKKHCGGHILQPLMLIAGLAVFTAGCGKSSSTTASVENAATLAETHSTLEETIASWDSDTNAAVEKFLTIDWSQHPLVSTTNVLGFSEAQFESAQGAGKAVLGKQMVEGVKRIKLICAIVDQKGKDALAGGDRVTAEKCFNQLKQCGDALSRPDSLIFVKNAGRTVTRMATNDLAALNQ